MNGEPVRRLIEDAHEQLPVVVEARGLQVTLRKVQPDEQAYHLEISDLQLTSYTVLPLDASEKDLKWEILKHLARKRQLSIFG